MSDIAAPPPVEPAPGAAAALAPAPPPVALGLAVPGTDAKPEDWKAFYKQIGAPDTGDAYKFEVPAGADPVFAKEAATVMAETGLLPHQAEALVKWYNGKAGTLTTAQTAAAAQAEQQAVVAHNAKVQADDAALKNEWGATHDANINTAKQAVQQFFPKDNAGPIIDALEKAVGYGQTMRIMYAIGKGLGEGTVRGVNSNAPEPQGGMHAEFTAALAKSGLGLKP